MNERGEDEYTGEDLTKEMLGPVEGDDLGENSGEDHGDELDRRHKEGEGTTGGSGEGSVQLGRKTRSTTKGDANSEGATRENRRSGKTTKENRRSGKTTKENRRSGKTTKGDRKSDPGVEKVTELAGEQGDNQGEDLESRIRRADEKLRRCSEEVEGNTRLWDALSVVVEELEGMAPDTRIVALNRVRERLSGLNPIQEQPVDLVRWVPADKVVANNYNPNQVAPPEMELLRLSIERDGYTQPIVVYHDRKKDIYIVVDGFHRNRVGKEDPEIRERVREYLPVVVIDKDIKDRMASTIRHNRARGVHGVEPMSKLVAELYFKGWSDRRIAKELGMDKEEVLRMKQFTGIGSLFQSWKYSQAWTIK